MEVAVNAVTAAIALAALVVSIRVSRRQTRIQEQQTGIQERLAAVEEARRADEVAARGRAQVTATIQPGRLADQGPGVRMVLVLRNDGPAVARRVLATVEERPGTPRPLGVGGTPG